MPEQPPAHRPHPTRAAGRRHRILRPRAGEHRVLEQPTHRGIRRFIVAQAAPRRSQRQCAAGPAPPPAPGRDAPSGITLVDYIPKAPSGKVDRAALAAKVAASPPSGTSESPATGGDEEQVLSLMRSILNSSDLGLDDDFFAHGGNSLLTSRLVAICRREHGRRIEFGSFIGEPTARTLLRLLGDE